MLGRSAIAAQLSGFRERIQRLETENASLRAHIEAEATALRDSASQLTAAAGSFVGAAVESFARAMCKPAKPGRAGGLARARQASYLGERWSNGRFMAHEDWEQIEREVAEAEYMRFAAGGFARAAGAMRATDGTYLPRR